MNSVLRSAVLGLTVACASTTQPGTSTVPDVRPAKPDSAPEAGPDSVQFSPTSGAYVIGAETRITQEFMGQRQEQLLLTNTFLESTVAPAAEGFEVTMAIDSVVPDSASQVHGLDVRDLYAGVIGLEYRARLDSGGHVLEFGGGDTTSTVAQQIEVALRSFYPRLPRGGVAPGAAWSDTTIQTNSMRGIELDVTTFAEYRATAWTEFEGQRALEVTIDSRAELAGRGSQGGQELDLQGSGTRSATSYFSSLGDYLGGSARDSTDLAVLVVSNGVVVPVLQIASIIVRRLPTP